MVLDNPRTSLHNGLLGLYHKFEHGKLIGCRKLIGEYYRQFFILDKDLGHICEAHPESCEFAERTMRENAAYVRRMVEAHRGEDPYWHMVGLFYEQMEGISKGELFPAMLACRE